MNDICRGQLQFAQKGKNAVLPVFGGLKGQEIIINLNLIKSTFEKNLQNIKGSDLNAILDINAQRWQDDYQQFKMNMKELEYIY
jgi:hypothetical protein